MIEIGIDDHLKYYTISNGFGRYFFGLVLFNYSFGQTWPPYKLSLDSEFMSIRSCSCHTS